MKREMRVRLGLSLVHDMAKDGMVVKKVQRGGAGDRAGLEIGDVLEMLNGNKVRSLTHFKSLVVDFQPGDKIAVKYSRDGAPLVGIMKISSYGDTALQMEKQQNEQKLQKQLRKEKKDLQEKLEQQRQEQLKQDRERAARIKLEFQSQLAERKVEREKKQKDALDRFQEAQRIKKEKEQQEVERKLREDQLLKKDLQELMERRKAQEKWKAAASQKNQAYILARRKEKSALEKMKRMRLKREEERRLAEEMKQQTQKIEQRRAQIPPHSRSEKVVARTASSVRKTPRPSTDKPGRLRPGALLKSPAVPGAVGSSPVVLRGSKKRKSLAKTAGEAANPSPAVQSPRGNNAWA